MSVEAPGDEVSSDADNGDDPSRPLTIDDVPRLGSGAGIAIGCGMMVLVAIVLFWFVRAWLL